MATNKFYNILKALEENLSTFTKIKTNIDKFSGNESIALLPVGQELIGQATSNVNYYQYEIAVLYKTAKELDSRALTQKSADIVEALNQTRTTVDSTVFYNGQTVEIIFSPDVADEEDEETAIAGVSINLQITFVVSSQEII